MRSAGDCSRGAQPVGLSLLSVPAFMDTPTDVMGACTPLGLEHISPGQLAELASAIAWENHRARLNRALGVREVGFSDGAVCVLPER